MYVISRTLPRKSVKADGYGRSSGSKLNLAPSRYTIGAAVAEEQVDKCFLQLRDSPGFKPGSLLILGTVVPGTDNWRQIYANAEEYYRDFAAGRND